VHLYGIVHSVEEVLMTLCLTASVEFVEAMEPKTSGSQPPHCCVVWRVSINLNTDLPSGEAQSFIQQLPYKWNNDCFVHTYNICIAI